MTARPETVPDIPARVRSAVEAALDKKAISLRVLELGAVTDFTDYFVVATGATERQVAAVADGIEERLRAEGVRPLSIEGLPQASWVLLDYGDFIVHLFTEDRRRHYALERLWDDAPDVTRDFAVDPDPRRPPGG